MREKTIAIIYHSQSKGHTRAAARLVAEGVREDEEFEVELHNTDDGRVSPRLLARCAAVAFGTPDYFSYPAGGMKMFADDWLIEKRRSNGELEGMPMGLFLTHGGGQRAQEPFESLFDRIGEQVSETVAIAGAPDEQAAQRCRELGRRLTRSGRTFLDEEGE